MNTHLECFVIDDEWHAVKLLSRFIETTVNLNLMGASTNPAEAIEQVTGTRGPDVTFLDVNMHQMSGLDFAAMAKMHTNIVFITSLPSVPKKVFAGESFEYLPKPISYQKFLKCIERIRLRLQR